MSLLFGFCCGVPLLVLWYVGLALVRRARALPKWGFVVAGLLPLPFVGLVAYSEGRYIVLDEGIVSAGCEGDAAQIERLIAWGADPNKPDDDGGLALPCAVTNGHVAAARVLLRHGADPNRYGFFGYPKEEASKSDDPAMRRLFGLAPKRGAKR